MAVLVASIVVQLKSAQADASRTPFTAVMVNKAYGAQGEIGHTQIKRIAVRSDGSMAELRDLVNGERSGVAVVRNVSTQRRTAIDPITESVTTYQMSQGELQALTGLGEPDCGAAEPVRRRIIMGQEAYFVGRRKSLRQNDGSDVNLQIDQWRVPALRCFVIQESAYQLLDKKVISRVDQEIISLTLGEPGEDLFRIPATFRERRPSEVFDEFRRKQGESAESNAQCARTRTILDQVYDASRVQK